MKKSHATQVLEYMQKHGSITSLEAFRHIGCTRLSGRIYDLRKKDYNISTTMESVPTRTGSTTPVAVYRLESDEKE